MPNPIVRKRSMITAIKAREYIIRVKSKLPNRTIIFTSTEKILILDYKGKHIQYISPYLNYANIALQSSFKIRLSGIPPPDTAICGFT